jgi:hypothetical protein
MELNSTKQLPERDCIIIWLAKPGLFGRDIKTA